MAVKTPAVRVAPNSHQSVATYIISFVKMNPKMIPSQSDVRDSRKAAQGAVAPCTERSDASLAERNSYMVARPCIEVRPCFTAGIYQNSYSFRKRLLDGVQSFANSSAFSSHRLILFSGGTLSPQYSTNRASSMRRAASFISASINLSALSM